MIPAEIIYIVQFLSIWAMSPVRVPYLRFYVGIYLSIVGLCGASGVYFPATFSQILLKFIQAFTIVDILNARGAYEIIQHIAILYTSKALENAPDVQTIPTLCSIAVAPTYYIAGEIWPTLFNGRLYALFLIVCSMGIPVYTVSTTAMSAYVFSIYMLAGTHAAYLLGAHVNS